MRPTHDPSRADLHRFDPIAPLASLAGVGPARTARVSIVMRGGRELGTVEELFVGRLKPGDTFTFAGRALALVRLEADKAVVRPAKGAGGPVPHWWGGGLPFTDELAASLRRTLDETAARIAASGEGPSAAPELAALRARALRRG